MGTKQARPDINIGEYQSRFKATTQNCQATPAEDRSCKDICCLVTFIIMTLIFIGAGIYFISALKGADWNKFQNSITNSSSSNSSSKSTAPTDHFMFGYPFHDHVNLGQSHFSSYHDQVSPTSTTTVSQFPDFSKALPWIILMSIFSLILSLVIVIAISKIPRVVVYGMIALTSICIVAGIVAGIVTGFIHLTIVCLIFGLVWVILLAIMLCCFRDQFQAAIVLLKVAGNFLKHKPSVFLAPISIMILSYFYFFFWLVSFIGIQLSRPEQELAAMSNASTSKDSTTKAHHNMSIYDGFTIVWLFFNLFYSYFLYYVMVFLIATATALWYYGIEENYFVKGLKNIWNAHIGSLTFASLMVAIVSMLRNAADNQNNNQNGCGMVCLCIVRCFLSFLEEIIKVLNHNAVIVMSVTGQDFIDSAKSTIYLIYNNFGIFMAVDMVQFLLKVCVLFLAILLPTGLGILLLKLTFNQASNVQDMYLILGGIIIFVVCLLMSMLIVTVLSEAISCAFIFFCLDQKFKQYNYGCVNRVPPELRSMFNEIQNQGRNVGADNFYRDSKQINSGAGYPAI